MPGKRILVVEDSPQLQSFLAEKLVEVSPCQVVVAGDGAGGLRLALRQPPDLIITEYLLPDQTGLDLLATLEDQGRRIPAIVITDPGTDHRLITPAHLDVRHYLAKPFTLQALAAAVHDALRPAGPSTRLSKALAQPTPTALIDVFTYSLQGADEPMLLADTRQHLLFYNRAAQTLFELPDPVPTASLALSDYPDIQALFTLPTDPTQITWRYEVSMPDSALAFDAHLTTLPDLGYLAILHDIGLLKEINRVKNDFVRQVSQDIRSPLTSILSYAELLGTAGTLNERQQTFIDRVVYSVQTITALLSDLLELNRVETDREPLREAVYLPLIIRYVVESLHREIEAHQQLLDLDLPDKIPPVMGNPAHFRKMVQHLLENSIKYTPWGGTLGISLRLENEFLVLRFSDSGIGIPTDEQPHVFEKFYRARNVPGPLRGTGLGLSIVKEIVEAHGGRIWPESPGEGQGTTFVVLLPARPSTG